MKIVILLFALIFGFGANFKNTAKDLKEISERHELNAAYKKYPNMLPVVDVVAPRI